MSVSDRKNALMWALGWWLMRRIVRRRASRAVADLTAGAAARKRSIGAIGGALLLVGLLAGGFVVWRRLTAAPEPAPPVIPYEPPSPSPEPAAA